MMLKEYRDRLSARVEDDPWGDAEGSMLSVWSALIASELELVYEALDQPPPTLKQLLNVSYVLPKALSEELRGEPITAKQVGAQYAEYRSAMFKAGAQTVSGRMTAAERREK